jgi:hypothetical protein
MNKNKSFTWRNILLRVLYMILGELSGKLMVMVICHAMIILKVRLHKLWRWFSYARSTISLVAKLMLVRYSIDLLLNSIKDGHLSPVC